MLALKPYHRYELEFRRIRLQDHAENAPDPTDMNGAVRDIEFSKVAFSVKPKRVVSSELNWDEIAAVLVNGRLIGLLNPSTLVSASKSFMAAIPANLPWVEKGEFVDPTQAGDIQEEELLCLLRYLKGLEKTLKETASLDNEIANPLISRIGDFSADCMKRLKRHAPLLANLDKEDAFEPLARQWDVPGHPVYSAVVRIATYKSDDGDKYDSALLVRRDLGIKGFAGAILIDPALPSALGKKPSDIVVWGITSLERLQTSSDRSALAKQAAESGFLWLEGKDLFSAKLCRIDGGSAPGHNGTSSQFLLPISQATLLFLTPTQIRDGIRIEPNAGGYTVTLNLTIVSSDGQSRKFPVKKEFSQADVVSSIEVPTTLAVWPNFQTDDWNWYYLFYSGNLALQVAPRGVVSTDGLAEFINLGRDTLARVRLADDLLRKPQNLSERLAITETELLKEAHVFRHPPEAIACDFVEGTQSGYVPPEQRTYLGLLLLKPLERIATSPDKASIGIDFGTSNTCVYFKREGEKPVPANFENRIVFPFATDDHSSRRALAEFFAARPVGMPFMSVQNLRALSKAVTTDRPLWPDHIYFYDVLLNALFDIQKKKGALELRFNLKWSKEPRDRERVRRFVSQAALMAAAEVAALGVSLRNIDWKFSYPEAFTPSQLHSFKSLYRGAIRRLADPIKENENFSPVIAWQSESLSAALYFHDRKDAFFTEDVITIDIGGHTSDVSIWQDKRLVWRSSLEIAGRHIVTSYLAANPKIIGEILKGDPDMDAALDEFKKLKKDEVQNGVEMIINDPAFSRKFAQNFALVMDAPGGQGLMLISELALAGILHFIGLQIKHLVSVGAFRPGRSRTLRICLGGRASLMFKSVFQDEPEDIKVVLSAAARAAGLEYADVSIVFSEEPKHECAYGLLAGEAKDLSLDGRILDVIIGEKISQGDTVLPDDAAVSILDFRKEIRVTDLAVLKGFLSSYSKASGLRIGVEESCWGEIAGAVNGSLEDSRKRAAEDPRDAKDDSDLGEALQIEPVFVSGLRELIASVVRKRATIDRSARR
jgi:hypothetical protein